MWNKLTIRAKRISLSLTQKQFAERIGTSQQMVSQWERGIHSPKGAYAKILTLTFGEPVVGS